LSFFALFRLNSKETSDNPNFRTLGNSWLTQSFVIKPGWTAVYLNVDASGYGQSIDQLVGSDPANPIVEIWLWRAAVSPAQYISNPLTLLSDGSHWIKWLRTSSATPNELGALVGWALGVSVREGRAFRWLKPGPPLKFPVEKGGKERK